MAPLTSARPRHDRYAGGEGTCESLWRSSAFEKRLPSISLDALVPRESRVVVVSPHPDDEVLATGGLLAMLSSLEHETLVVSVTDGEASHSGSPTWTPLAVAARRRDELEVGLRRLGQDKACVRHLCLPDSEVRDHEERLASALVRLLRLRDVLFVTSESDGHPDHEACSRAAQTACAKTGVRMWEVPVWTWHWSHPADPRFPWDRARVLALDADARRRKRDAIAAHRSQLEPDLLAKRPPILPSDALAHFDRPFEVFFEHDTLRIGQ